jgi:hypothetical protein
MGHFNEQFHRQELSNNHSLVYVVTRLPDADYQEMHGLESFPVTIGECALCLRSSRYPDIDDAYEHLYRVHAQRKEKFILQDEKRKLGHWLVSTTGAELERKNNDFLSLVRIILSRTEKLLYRAMEIRASVANDQLQRSSEYLLPTALVMAAEKIFQFIYTAYYTVQYLHSQHGKSSGLSSIEVQDNASLAEHFGVAAGHDLSKAQNELLWMAHTGTADGTSVVRYTASTPETTIYFGLGWLIFRKLHLDMDIQELYQNHLSSLVSIQCSLLRWSTPTYACT